MMKPAKVTLLVDSVEDAVKFYSDKLGFDIHDLMEIEGGSALRHAELHKGKCCIIFRVPHQEEVVEFSQIKYAATRGTGMFVEGKKGIEKYYARCKSKGITIVEPLKKESWGYETFTIKDPFGFKVMFGQRLPNYQHPHDSFVGLRLDRSKDTKSLTDEMIRHIRRFGLSQRAAKKFVKAWLKHNRK